MAIELFHVGEILVAEILSRLQDRGALDQVLGVVSGDGSTVSLLSDLKAADVGLQVRFAADSASVVVHSGSESFSCDGAQTIDVLCYGSNGFAVALEAKLGETRMRSGEFRSRFCVSCERADHLDARVRGSMVAVLEHDFPFLEEAELIAHIDDQEWRVHRAWWLVVRRQVWKSWRGMAPVRNARVLLFEDLASIYGSDREFDELVSQVIGTDFASRWKVYEER